MGSLTLIVSDDDSGGSGTSRVTFAAVAGTVYRIAVDGYGGATGSITLTYSIPAPPDYSVSTGGGIMTVTDLTGGSDTLAISEPSAGNILFAAPGRNFSVNGGPSIPGDSGSLSRTGITSIVVNAGAGADIINVGAFTGTLPPLTINGGTGDDAVNFNGDITFAANASLDVDLQNDDAAPGADTVVIGLNTHLIASGTGSITIKASKNVDMNPSGLAGSATLQTVNGDITIEANQQAVQSAGTFYGFSTEPLNASSNFIKATGTGNVTIKGRGAVGGASVPGISILNTTVSTNTGALTLIGNGGDNTFDQNNGVQVHVGAIVETTGGGAITITGAGGSGALPRGMGVRVLLGGIVRNTGAGSITLNGTAGTAPLGVLNYGVSLDSTSSVTSSGSGPITINATAGPSGTPLVPAFKTVTSTNRVGFDGVNTYSGNIIINADSMDIANAVIRTTGSATLRQKTTGTLINLGAADVFTGSPLTLGLTDAELDQVTAGTVQIGDSSSGAITVSAAITRPSSTNVALQSADNIVLNPGTLNTGGGYLVFFTYGSVQPITSGTEATTSATGVLGFGGGTNLALAIAGTTVDSGYHQLNVAGLVNLTGPPNLVLSGSYVPVAGNSFILVNNDGTDAITGAFNGRAEGSTFTFNGVPMKITYTGGTGNDVVITALTALENWRQTYFGSPANSGNGADAFDFDKDGILNLAEFGFGLNPTQNSAGLLPRPQKIGSNFVATFTQPAGVSGITYGAEWSTTLQAGSWTAIPDTGSGSTHTFSIAIGTAKKLFMRLNVTNPNP